MDDRKLVLVPIVLVILFGATLLAQERLPYQDPKLPVEQRVTDLLKRMTLEEKIAQLEGSWQNRDNVKDPQALFVDEKRNFLPAQASRLLKNGLGEMSRPSEKRGPREMADFTNTLQKWMKENTRLGIPILFHEECLHGHAAPRGTSFPQAIALASTWDPVLVRDVFAATAAEVRARGAQQCLAPVLDLARDPRWGRTEETYGEDPYLVSRIGVAAIQGFQGVDPFIDKSHVVATAKHFAVHGQPEGGTNVAPGNYSERVIREYFLKPFKAAVEEGGVQSVMPSYNEIDGVPSHGNKHLLDDVLRREWGFPGVVVSDYFAIADLNVLHHIVSNNDEAAKLALESGVDVELPFGNAYHSLIKQVREGKVSQGDVDRAVGRILRLKFLTGLFDDASVDPDYAEKITNNAEHQQLALKAAHDAIILLKNQNNLLPLDRKTKYKRIAVIGPNAAELHLGGIRNKVGSTAEVLYSEGCKITETAPDWYADKVVLGDPALNAKRIAAAVQVAKKADVIILVLGENEQTSREAWAPTHEGDRDSLDLLGNQDDLTKAIVATGKPTAVFLIHGRPNSINYIAANVPAILDGWYLGQETGTAVADVLFGDYNPGGKLPITVPRTVGQLPDYYYQKPSAKREYLGTSTQPLFPFGYGLSYSTFKYSNLRLAPDTIGPQGQTKISVDVTNTGKLRGFQRISLDPGQSHTVEFMLGPEQLSFLDHDMQRVVEPGTFKIMVGGSSVDVIETKLNVVAK